MSYDDGSKIAPFPIDSRGSFLHIIPEDVINIMTIVDKTGLITTPINELIEVFRSNATENTLLSKDGFDAVNYNIYIY